ncbi:ribbon-helix-helix domain-containing protein [Metallosphaera sedula]|uniref:ribbon-helix-helix domain-containing protein n=1 Tax=Metallosphaera sedula TaxID=43687 RepID=UPI0020BD634F|nr:ribbon-helix-helix domain-containing protein [Metallosphaera sedula]BBL47845.1 putative nickel-responsive regulator [Metallosphaera sedula]
MKKPKNPVKVSVILDKGDVDALDRIVKKEGYHGKSEILRLLAKRFIKRYMESS